MLTVMSTNLVGIEKAPGEFLPAIYRYRATILVGLVILAYLPRAVLHVRSARSTRRLLSAFLECLHERLFPMGLGRMDTENYRASIFVPCLRPGWRRRFPYFLRRHLKLLSRSTLLHPVSRVTWDIDSSSAGKYDGVVGYAYATGLVVSLPDLPDYDHGNEKQRREYCKKTYLTEEKAERLNRRCRIYMASTIIDKRGAAVAVLVLESMFPAGLKKLNEEELDREARHLQKLFL